MNRPGTSFVLGANIRPHPESTEVPQDIKLKTMTGFADQSVFSTLKPSDLPTCDIQTGKSLVFDERGEEL